MIALLTPAVISEVIPALSKYTMHSIQSSMAATKLHTGLVCIVYEVVCNDSGCLNTADMPSTYPHFVIFLTMLYAGILRNARDMVSIQLEFIFT